MKRIAFGLIAALSFSAGLVAQGGQTAPPPPPDPRVGLKAGFRDAGTAARNMVLVSSLPKPEGFDDPDGSKGLTFANSDIAFGHDTLYLGNFYGINFYDVEDPSKVRLKTSIPCQGGQGDVSVYGKLLFMSVESTSGRIDCGPAPVVAPAPPAPNAAGAAAPAGRGGRGAQQAPDPNRFRGVRIFDISDPLNPKQIAAVQTCRGSHTHSLVTSVKDKDNIYIYGSGTSGVRSGEELAGCVADENDPNTSLFSIDVIKVPLASPEKAAVVNRPRIFADEATGALGGLWQGGNHGPGTQTSRLTTQCHDITVYSEIGLAAGACAGNGILMDISDPRNPKRLDFVSDKSFAYWHSATFNNDGTKIVFTDEWGGGSRPRCRATDPLTWGADAIFDIVDRKLVFRGYYKMPAAQGEQENCVAHNGSLIPVPGRDIMVQAWYQGGLSMFDFTDSANAKEIAYFDRGPLNGQNLVLSGYWSTYWYNGSIYGAEIARGIDVFRLKPSELLSQNEIDAAIQFRLNEFNSQNQPRVTWPATSAVAKAYLDQLGRTNGIAPERARAVRDALAKADELRTGKERDAAARLDALTALASQVETDAKSKTGRDAMRLTALADTLRGRAAALR